jgi:uncharacterized protein (TIGR03066 family)
MRAFCTVVLGIVMIAGSGMARAQDDNGKKIVGIWEVVKSASNLPVGSTVEFTKDGKLNAVLKESPNEIKLDGTYKIEKDKLTVKIKIGETSEEEVVTVKKLTDEALEIEDKDKKVDVFKKKKQ